MKNHRSSRLVKITTLIISAAWLPAIAQTPASLPAVTTAMAPPINHESGTIADVLTAEDGGYRLRGYIVTWRGSRVFVAGAAADPHQVGGNLDFTVYRSAVNGQRGLRFAVTQPGDDDSSVAQDESRNSQASITAGTAKVEDVLAADNDGYSFVAYIVHWHDRRVVVVDPSLHTPKSVGDQIDFRVLHTGAAEARQLSFVLGG